MSGHNLSTFSANGDNIPRILLIDPSALMHRLLRNRLQLEHVDIVSATRGEEGFQKALELIPDVILLETEFPSEERTDGFEILQRLKEDARTKDISVIFVSESRETMDRVRGLDLGAVDFVSKPFEMAELKARVRTALRMQKLLRMLAQCAQRDGLTALWNRAYLDQRLAAEHSEAQRHARHLSVILCDIDHFKSVNDRYGHPFGDEVLAHFATILAGGRVSDVPCRYGGEEFAVILPGTTVDEATEVAERFRAAFEAHRWRRHPDLVLTASFGVAAISPLQPMLSGADLIKRADDALYQAKRGGRNRVSWRSKPDAA
ncbi:MAG: Response regulator PleD [Planctomycetota bacterium]